MADLCKSEYFRPSAEVESPTSHAEFEHEFAPVLASARKDGAKEPAACWDVDELENAIAFVGASNCVSADWLSRARRMAGRTPRICGR